MARRKRLGEVLMELGVISASQVQDALVDTARPGRLGERLVADGAVDDEMVARALAEQFGLRYIDPLTVPHDPKLLQALPPTMVAEQRVLPIRKEAGVVQVAVGDPLDLSLLDDLRFIFRARIQPMVAAPSKLRQAFNRGQGLGPQAHRMLAGARPDRLSDRALSSAAVHDLEAGEIVARLEAGGQRPYVDLVSLLIVHAANRGASDIHFEPQSASLRVRFRVDGMLRAVMTLPVWSAKPLASRVKVLAEMDVANHRTPQDGKFRVTVDGRRLDLRVAVVPSQFGEKVVVRLLDPTMVQTDLSTLGWDAVALRRYYHMVSRPRGLVLCVGPTGSGKTTTLYATIHRLRTETASIVTIEDPIEYTLDGIVQLEVHEKSGMTFATSIRSILRQDANVVVVGEIRDAETALAAVEATTTGHLVLSTLHTTQAVSTIVRLLELGVPPYLLGDALTGIVAQRLVRRVCKACSVLGPPQPEDWARFGIAPEDIGTEVRRAGTGCAACDYVGYRGRVGLFEVLPLSDTLRGLVLDEAGERALWAQARKEGLRTLFDDALSKVADGLTTLAEVARVVPVDPWRTGGRAAHNRPLSLLRTPAPVLDAMPAPAPAPAPAPEPEILPAVLTPASARRVVRIGARAPSVAPASAPPEVAAEPTQPLVLVVDDAAEIRQLVAITLEDDYRIITACDGVEAIEAVLEHAPDLVVLDVMMPRMSGYEVCDRLKGDPRTEALPVIMLSARGQRGHIKEGLRRGADDYLPKPFDPEELELRVRALLRRSRRG